jgi:hypothetical protein
MRNILAIGALLTGIGAAYYNGAGTLPRLPLCVGETCIRWRGQPANSPQFVDSSPATDRDAWAIDLLARLDNSQPSADIVAFVVAWTRAEDGGSGAIDRHNPLNTTQDAPGAWPINGVGVKGYPDYETGMNATIETLTNGLYDPLVIGLQTNDAQLALQGLCASPWGTSCANVETLYNARQAHQETRTGTEAPWVGACPVDPCVISGYTFNAATHPGVDYGASAGQPVYATMDGVVSNAAGTWPGGNCAAVLAGEWSSLDCHLSAFALDDGALVRAGDVIGYAGATGLASGVHVHHEIRYNNASVEI